MNTYLVIRSTGFGYSVVEWTENHLARVVAGPFTTHAQAWAKRDEFAQGTHPTQQPQEATS